MSTKNKLESWENGAAELPCRLVGFDMTQRTLTFQFREDVDLDGLELGRFAFVSIPPTRNGPYYLHGDGKYGLSPPEGGEVKA